MNNRSLTRGDAVVIGAAVLLFIASFLGFYSAKGCDGDDCSVNAWEPALFPVLPSVFLAGVIAAALIVAGRFLPAERKLVGLTLPQWGTALAVFAVWSSFWGLFGGGESVNPGVGGILGFLGTLILAGGAIATTLVPALQAPLIPASAPPQMGYQPYGAGQQPGYGYPGAPQQGQPQPGYGYGYPGGAQQPGQPQPHQPQPTPQDPQQSYGGQPQQPQQGQPQPQPQPQQAAAPDPNFQPFWFAVPVPRPLFGEDGSPAPVAELAPGTWYLAVEQRGQALIAQTQDGRRGLLQDTSGIQRG
ncbi:DUF5336 domain-containing protein [Streptomyces gobiensis]|uniref:DUF5336 domain-containing protein n=1 Tax=Streptomyces gobiensis TaxID=2875706 RepID=UPI001E488E82|nr:DUF5336 domain-containing protein [Streptomyces gobiensis]UGY91123.1 DUF5336 domain-containing protein [Streptomyces gobiensis]